MNENAACALKRKRAATSTTEGHDGAMVPTSERQKHSKNDPYSWNCRNHHLFVSKGQDSTRDRGTKHSPKNLSVAEIQQYNRLKTLFGMNESAASLSLFCRMVDQLALNTRASGLLCEADRVRVVGWMCADASHACVRVAVMWH